MLETSQATTQNESNVSMSMSPLDMALAKRKENEQKREEAKNSFSNWGDLVYPEIVGLKNKEEVVVRIVGNPAEVREKGSDPKLILQSQVSKDDKKGYSYLNWSYIEDKEKIVPDPNWIVTRFMNKVFEKKWVDYTEKDIDGETIVARNGKIVNTAIASQYNTGYYNFFHEKTEIYKLLTAGNSKEGEKYSKKFYPTKRIICNVIDRMDNWCAVNKHTKILSGRKSAFEIKKEDGTKDVIYFSDTGIPISLYDEIIEHCKAVGTLDIDLVLVKESESQAKYKVWDITDVKYLKDQNTLKVGKKDALTEEEKNYEAYDIDNHPLYKVSSYQKIKTVLGSRFALCDAELGTNFNDELNALVKKEKEEKEVNTTYLHNSKEKVLHVEHRPKEEWIKNYSDFEVISSDEYFKLRQQYESEKGEQEASRPALEKEASKDMSWIDESVQSVTEQPTQTRRAPIVTVTEDLTLIGLCEKNFDYWSKLSKEEQVIMIDAIDKFENGVIPFFKENSHPGCNNLNCFFKGTKIVTVVPEAISVCPVCGVQFK